MILNRSRFCLETTLALNMSRRNQKSKERETHGPELLCLRESRATDGSGIRLPGLYIKDSLLKKAITIGIEDRHVVIGLGGDEWVLIHIPPSVSETDLMNALLACPTLC